MDNRRLFQPQKIKEVLEEHNFTFSKALGQNFLIDGNILRKIVEGAGVTKEDNVLEVGPGFGTLTEELAQYAKKVYCVEKDHRLIPILKETLSSFDNIQFIESDILEFDWEKFFEEEKINKPIKVVANLPYYITTPIIESMLKRSKDIESITVMVQKEVAERMIANEKDKNYGSLSLFIGFHAEASILTKVRNTVFMPKPDVDSAVVHLKIRDMHYKGNVDFLFQIIRSGFTKRRKTIMNSFTSGFADVKKEALREVLASLSLSEKLRAENLSLEDYMNIALALEKN